MSSLSSACVQTTSRVRYQDVSSSVTAAAVLNVAFVLATLGPDSIRSCPCARRWNAGAVVRQAVVVPELCHSDDINGSLPFTQQCRDHMSEIHCTRNGGFRPLLFPPHGVSRRVTQGVRVSATRRARTTPTSIVWRHRDDLGDGTITKDSSRSSLRGARRDPSRVASRHPEWCCRMSLDLAPLGFVGRGQRRTTPMQSFSMPEGVDAFGAGIVYLVGQGRGGCFETLTCNAIGRTAG
jgi:hypothetical protein